jgi:hypothetical protein
MTARVERAVRGAKSNRAILAEAADCRPKLAWPTYLHRRLSRWTRNPRAAPFRWNTCKSAAVAK